MNKTSGRRPLTAGRRPAIAPLWLAGTMATLVACGGGGDAGSSSPQVPTALASSNGAPAAYVGTWVSDCGWVVLSSSVKSIRNTYRLTAAAGPTVTGTLEQLQYSDTNCTVQWPSAGFPPLTAPVSIKVLGSAAFEAPSGKASEFAGSADRIEVTTQYAAHDVRSKTQFAAFSDGGKLRFTDALPFSVADLVYTRR